MKLALTQEERDKVLLDIFCNGGLSYLSSSEVELNYLPEDYRKAKQSGDCYEDVLLRMINTGSKLFFVDIDEGEFSRTLTKEVVEQSLTNVEDKHFCQLVLESLNEESDAETGYNLIQFILYGKLIFG